MTTPSANMIAVTAFVEKLQDHICYLWARWQDEKEFEDINEYGASIAKNFPEGWKLIKSTKRPFGVTFSIGEEVWVITATSRAVSWKRTK